MSKYIINYKIEFKTRPSKFEVESKLFDLLAKGFTLRTPEEQDDYVKAKEIINLFEKEGLLQESDPKELEKMIVSVISKNQDKYFQVEDQSFQNRIVYTLLIVISYKSLSFDNLSIHESQFSNQ